MTLGQTQPVAMTEPLIGPSAARPDAGDGYPSRSKVAAALGEPVPPVSIENPILNSPFHEPTRQFKFDDDGITSEWVSTRGTASVTL